MSAFRWRYRRRRLWVLPTVIVVVAVCMSSFVPYLDREYTAQWWDEEFDAPLWKFDAGVTASVLSAVASGTIAFTGFVFTVVLLSVQFGTSSFSARLIPLFSGDLLLRTAMGIFMATFVYSLLISIRLGARVEDYDPVLSALFAVALALASVVMFFALLGRAIDLLRVVRLLGRVARFGEKTIDAEHPDPYGDPLPSTPDTEPTAVVRYRGRSLVLLGIDSNRLARIAARANVHLVLVPAIGDFVVRGNPLFEIYGDGRVSQRKLGRHLAFGVERELWGDPGFALRALVDVAIKALSPGINDPTTAVQSLDYLSDLLVRLSGRRLGAVLALDRTGKLRVTYRTSDWEDYLSLALDEIRHYGRDSVQVTRRLRAVLNDLLAACPDRRRAPVSARIAALDDLAPSAFPLSLDRQVASVADPQGMGSSVVAEGVAARHARFPGGDRDSGDPQPEVSETTAGRPRGLC